MLFDTDLFLQVVRTRPLCRPVRRWSDLPTDAPIVNLDDVASTLRAEIDELERCVAGRDHSAAADEVARLERAWRVLSDRDSIHFATGHTIRYSGAASSYVDSWIALDRVCVVHMGGDERFHVPGVHPAAYVHPTAMVHPTARLDAGSAIGPDAQIGPHAHVGADTTIGRDSRVCHGAFVGNRVSVEPRCVIGAGARVDADVALGGQVAVGAGAVVPSRSRVPARARVPHHDTSLADPPSPVRVRRISAAIDQALHLGSE